MQKKQAYFRFYAELNDFLADERRHRTFTYSFSLQPAVKDAIEACGVPHSEVEVILANGNSVDFTYRLGDGDRLAVYPLFESFDVSPLIRLRPKPLRKIKFIADENLGKLIRKLRMLGFDTITAAGPDSASLIQRAISEQRIILTRDRELLKNKQISHAYWVRSQDVRQQIREIYQRFDLARLCKPFSRCMNCNALLKKAAKKEIIDLIPERTAQQFGRFRQCPDCKKVYWPGSHFKKMEFLIESLRNE